MSITTLLFDLDGTLIDSNPVIIEAWQRAAAKVGVVLSEDDIKQHVIGASFHHTLETLFSQFSKEEQDKIHQDVDDYEEIAPTTMIEGAFDFLHSCKKQGYKMALVTSSWQAKISNVLARHKININLFDVIVNRADIAHGKPHPDCFLLALEKLGSKAEEALVFEDSMSGLKAAHSAGIKVVLINPSFATSNPEVEVIKDFTHNTHLLHPAVRG